MPENLRTTVIIEAQTEYHGNGEGVSYGCSVVFVNPDLSGQDVDETYDDKGGTLTLMDVLTYGLGRARDYLLTPDVWLAEYYSQSGDLHRQLADIEFEITRKCRLIEDATKMNRSMGMQVNSLLDDAERLRAQIAKHEHEHEEMVSVS